MIENIINEMVLGNFSFLILIVGIIQACIMLSKREVPKVENTETVVDESEIGGIEITFIGGGSEYWDITTRKQFAIHGNELIIFDENGKFVAWYNLSEVRSVNVLEAGYEQEEE